MILTPLEFAVLCIVTAIAILALLVLAMGLTAAAVTLACLAVYALVAGAIAVALTWAARGQARHDATALAIVCDPCHGKPGRCVCAEKCEWELCGADDTGVHDITAELDAWFREGQQ